MTGNDNHARKKMQDSIKLREERRARWEREGERSIGQNMAMIGALGWLIVVPTLIGVMVGRWIDRWFGTGIFWTAALIFLGLTLGCIMVWKRIERE